MAQNYNQQPPYNPPPRESSGMGVVLGVLLAVVVAIGAYFFMQNRNLDNAALEPAAGTEAPATGGMMAQPSNTAPAPAPETSPSPAP